MKRATKHEKKMSWLGENETYLEANFPGMWVAISDAGLAGVGKSPGEARARAAADGVSDVMISGVKSVEYQGKYLIRRWPSL